MKKIIVFTAIIICLVIINNLAHSIISTWESRRYLIEAQNSLNLEEKKHKQLVSQLQKVSQPQFIREQARDKLLLVKPGEDLVLIPSGAVSPISTTQPTIAQSAKPNWQQWWNYFFGN